MSRINEKFLVEFEQSTRIPSLFLLILAIFKINMQETFYTSCLFSLINDNGHYVVLLITCLTYHSALKKETR